MRLWKRLLSAGASSLVGLGLLSGSASAATIGWNFTDLNATFDTGTPLNFTVGDFSIGDSYGTVSSPINATSASSGYTGASGGGNIGNAAKSLTLDPLTTAYYQVTFTALSGYTLSFSELDFGARSTATGPKQYAIRSSLDNYAGNLATGLTGNNSTWALKTNALTLNSATDGGAVTLRIYTYDYSGNPGSGTENQRLDDIAITLLANSSGSSSQTTNYFGATGQGGSGVWDTTTTTWSGNLGAGTFNTLAWNATLPTVFGGTAGTVAVSPVAPTAGLQFNAPGYILNGGQITLTTVNTVGVTSGNTATINSRISGSAGLNKTDAGTLILGNTTNDFTGTVSVSGGVLSVGDNAHLGDVGNAIALAGGTLQTTASISTGRAVSGSGTLDIATGTTLTSSGSFGTTSLTLNNGGTLALNGVSPSVGVLTFIGPATVTSSGTISTNNSTITATSLNGTATISAPINLGSGTKTVNIGPSGTLVLSDIALTGTGTQSLQLLGTGTAELHGNNSGLYRVQIGTTGTAGGTVKVYNNTTLGANQTFLNAGTLQAMTDLTGGNALAVGVSLGGRAGSAVPVIAGSNVEFTGASALFQSSGNVNQLTVNNTTILSGAFASGTGTGTGFTVGGTGQLIINGNASAMNLATTLQDSVTLVVNNAYGTGVTVNGDASLAGSSSGSIAGNVTFNSTANSLFAGAISDGSGPATLTKGGSGTATLTGTSSYTGSTIINAGKLVAGSNSAFGSGGITINSGELITAPGVTLSNAITANPGTAVGAQTALISGASLNGIGGAINPGEVGNVGTTITLNGTSQSNTTLQTAWLARSAAQNNPSAPDSSFSASNGFNLVSDVCDLSGLNGNLFVLQMKYDPSQLCSPATGFDASLNNILATSSSSAIYLASYDSADGKWKNAVAGNSGGTPNYVQGAYNGSLTLGTFGVDTTTNVAWVVVDHNTQFAVVPEPGTLGLLAFGCMAVLRIRRKNTAIKANG